MVSAHSREMSMYPLFFKLNAYVCVNPYAAGG